MSPPQRGEGGKREGSYTVHVADGLECGKLGVRQGRRRDGRIGSLGKQLLTLLHPCRARMVRRVTKERMASQDSL